MGYARGPDCAPGAGAGAPGHGHKKTGQWPVFSVPEAVASTDQPIALMCAFRRLL